ncbi:MAG TPA: ABC transporter substrate-binding protein [Chloroflexota bacterium]|jgi:NitT/TauT family transport system substrate-binding protein
MLTRLVSAVMLIGLLGSACASRASAPAAPAAAPANAPAQSPSSLGGSGGPPAAASEAAPPASAAAKPVPLPQPLTVRFANAGIAAQTPTFLGIEQGYFQELGINIEVHEITSTNDMVALLSGDQLEVGHQAISPALFNAAARGVGVRIVADHGGNIPGRTTPNLSARTDLLERQPWAGYQNLKGYKVAISSLGTLSEYSFDLMLAKGGLQPSDVDIVPLAFPDMAVAFSNKAIDAGMFNEPWATQLEDAGVIKKVVYTDDVDPNGNVSGVEYSETFARNQQAARNYMVAYLRGVRDYWDAYDGRRDFQIIVDVQKKFTPVKDERLIRKVPPTGMKPDGYLNLEKIAQYQDWFIENELVTQKVDLSQVIDHSFLDYANGILGPYQPVEHPQRPS